MYYDPMTTVIKDSYKDIEGMCRNDDCQLFEETQEVEALLEWWTDGTVTASYECAKCGDKVDNEDYDDSPDWDALGKALRELD